MNIKEDIENILLDLKSMKIDRRMIERDMDYEEKYIDQVISKGGNQKFLKRLQKYHLEKIGKGNTSFNKQGIVGNEVSKLIEMVISQQAIVNVLLVTVENISAAVKEKEVSLVSAQLKQAIKMESDRLFDEYVKKQR